MSDQREADRALVEMQRFYNDLFVTELKGKATAAATAAEEARSAAADAKTAARESREEAKKLRKAIAGESTQLDSPLIEVVGQLDERLKELASEVEAVRAALDRAAPGLMRAVATSGGASGQSAIARREDLERIRENLVSLQTANESVFSGQNPMARRGDLDALFLGVQKLMTVRDKEEARSKWKGPMALFAYGMVAQLIMTVLVVWAVSR